MYTCTRVIITLLPGRRLLLFVAPPSAEHTPRRIPSICSTLACSCCVCVYVHNTSYVHARAACVSVTSTVLNVVVACVCSSVRIVCSQVTRNGPAVVVCRVVVSASVVLLLVFRYTSIPRPLSPQQLLYAVYSVYIYTHTSINIILVFNFFYSYTRITSLCRANSIFSIMFQSYYCFSLTWQWCLYSGGFLFRHSIPHKSQRSR